MPLRLKAVYHNGVFVPTGRCEVADGSEVELIVREPSVLSPRVTDPEERRRILEAMTERMRQNPLPPDAPRFSREALHERG